MKDRLSVPNPISLKNVYEKESLAQGKISCIGNARYMQVSNTSRKVIILGDSGYVTHSIVQIDNFVLILHAVSARLR